MPSGQIDSGFIEFRVEANTDFKQAGSVSGNLALLSHIIDHHAITRVHPPAVPVGLQRGMAKTVAKPIPETPRRFWFIHDRLCLDVVQVRIGSRCVIRTTG